MHETEFPPRKHRPARWVLLLAMLGLRSFAPAHAVAPGWERFDVPVTGSYAFRYVPHSLDQSEPAPAVVFLHGSGSNPEQWRPLLQPIAEAQQVVLILPKALDNLGFGVGADDRTIVAALAHVRAEMTLDEQRIGLGGHSAGGAYAAVVGYSAALRFSGVFIMSSPYRTVLALGDPDYTPPLRTYYGTNDPNYQNGSYQGYKGQWQRLGIPVTEEIDVGYGHSDWPPTTLPDGFAFLLAQRYGTAGGCVPSDTRLCLRQGRFAVEASWHTGQGDSGVAHTVGAKTGDSGLLWFFGPENWELQVKVLNGCPVNQRYWVFAAGTTNVEYTLTVTDLAHGTQAVYHNPQGVSAPAITDSSAFATCP
jgi:predicted esterase